MKFARFFELLLKITMPCCVLFLFLSCSDEGIQVMPEIQPARLMKVTSDNHYQDTRDWHFPDGKGDEVLALQDWAELVFDKAVSQVIIDVDNVLGYARPNGIPPTTIWIVKVGELNLPSLPYFRTPKKNVPFTVIYEDKTGLHQETFKVALGNYELGPEPPTIDSSNVSNNQIDADANQLNQEGIRISFSNRIDPHRTRIEVYSGRWKLNWKVYWTDRIETAILLPESKGARLLPGREYEIHLLALYSAGGTKRDAPLVITFQTAD